jgi:hypothetical protein
MTVWSICCTFTLMIFSNLSQNSIPHCGELLLKCWRFDVQLRISAPPKSLGKSGKLCLWGNHARRSHMGWNQVNRQDNQCHLRSASDSPKQWQSLQNVRSECKILILFDRILLLLTWSNDLWPWTHDSLAIEEWMLGTFWAILYETTCIFVWILFLLEGAGENVSANIPGIQF